MKTLLWRLFLIFLGAGLLLFAALQINGLSAFFVGFVGVCLLGAGLSHGDKDFRNSD